MYLFQYVKIFNNQQNVDSKHPIVFHSEVLQNQRNMANSNWIENNDFLLNRFLIAN